MSTKRNKSQRRWVHDAGVPTFTFQSHRKESVVFHVAGIGRPETTVSFQLQWWQVMRLIKGLRAMNADAVKQWREQAAIVEDYVK